MKNRKKSDKKYDGKKEGKFKLGFNQQFLNLLKRKERRKNLYKKNLYFLLGLNMHFRSDDFR